MWWVDSAWRTRESCCLALILRSINHSNRKLNHISDDCKAGQYRSLEMLRCERCQGNTVSEKKAANCVECSAGTVSNDNNTVCGKCFSQDRFINIRHYNLNKNISCWKLRTIAIGFYIMLAKKLRFFQPILLLKLLKFFLPFQHPQNYVRRVNTETITWPLVLLVMKEPKQIRIGHYVVSRQCLKNDNPSIILGKVVAWYNSVKSIFEFSSRKLKHFSDDCKAGEYRNSTMPTCQRCQGNTMSKERAADCIECGVLEVTNDNNTYCGECFISQIHHFVIMAF